MANIDVCSISRGTECTETSALYRAYERTPQASESDDDVLVLGRNYTAQKKRVTWVNQSDATVPTRPSLSTWHKR